MPAGKRILEAPVQIGLAFDAPVVPRTRRVALDPASWVEHHAGWLAAPDALFEKLGNEARWEQRTRWMVDRHVVEPRLTAEYPVLADCPVAELVAVGRRLDALYDMRFDRAWVNLYRDHTDSTSWHADKPASLFPECIVPVLSLGETRRFLVRHRDGGPSTTFVCESGDLIVMGGRCQRDWVHGVPKETRAKGSRISINFASSVPRQLR